MDSLLGILSSDALLHKARRKCTTIDLHFTVMLRFPVKVKNMSCNVLFKEHQSCRSSFLARVILGGLPLPSKHQNILNVHQKRWQTEHPVQCPFLRGTARTHLYLTLPSQHQDDSLQLGLNSNPGSTAQKWVSIPLGYSTSLIREEGIKKDKFLESSKVLRTQCPAVRVLEHSVSGGLEIAPT